MEKYKEMWFQSMCDIFCKVEMQTMEQKEYLELAGQLEMAKDELLQLVPDHDKAAAAHLVERLEEYCTLMYNIMMKDMVTAIEFKDF